MKPLSTEKKLSIVVMPILLAVLVGLVIPAISRKVSPTPTPERNGVVKILDVETGVPLSAFHSGRASARLLPRDYTLASQEVPVTEPDATSAPDEGVAPGDTGGTDETDETNETNGTDETDDTDGTDGTDETDETDGTDETDETNGIDETDDENHQPFGDTAGETGGDEGDPNDIDGDGVTGTDDMCPTTKGNLPSGCYAAQLRSEPYGCDKDDMLATLQSDDDGGSERCEALDIAVAGDTTGGKPGDVEARADAVAAALHETRTAEVRGAGGRLEPLGVVVTIKATVTGLNGKPVYVRWSLRRANGRALPQQWLRNRRVLKLTSEAERDSGGAQFWVPLPKRPKGPFIVRVRMDDDQGTPLTFAKSHAIR